MHCCVSYGWIWGKLVLPVRQAWLKKLKSEGWLKANMQIAQVLSKRRRAIKSIV